MGDTPGDEGADGDAACQALLARLQLTVEVLPGGLRTAIAFALSRSAKRGRPLKRGELIATGNATGIHDIRVGQTAVVRFAGFGDIACRAVAAG